jgi:hypothetical protein
MTSDFRRALSDDLQRLTPPPGDLARAVSEGRRLRRRRRGAVAAGVAAAVAVLAVVAGQLGGGSSTSDVRRIDPIGRLDFSGGLRAYAAPGAEIHLGGRTFPGRQLEYLDTDAVATPVGVVFYDRGLPQLLRESGEITPLEPGPAVAADDFRPTAKADAAGALVAYAVARDGGGATVTVRDLASGEVVSRRQVPGDVVIDALDGGVAFLRTDGGTAAWDTASDDYRLLAGPDTRVADVRNGVVLYDGPEPDGPAASDYRLVPGAIDAQLTFDGRHVLYWSSALQASDGGRPIVLDQGPTTEGGYAFWAMDTDGSVLVAVPGRGAHSTVYDCEVPSGACTKLGPLETLHGDPMFIGVDM